ncbi:Ger(x)C family spore germination protein [Paenibacillus filicis]|uniref:Ger(X)C family spore germination protein n=1 Tax=Paenibacillus gyeongsangnamensis TaxID=3388067 RepID=A0ABT4Q7H8_9BACL|nr:Ger(x)C family spore germination protein [Paenibacillus filicis]MCZ8512789.1 Ger(x)C family spore germination protein [Paenibacillus filicis]
MIRMKWCKLIASVLCLSLITGCWDRSELNDIAFVLAAGIDLAENGQAEVTLQIALPTEMPSTMQGGRGGKRTVLVVSEKGRDGADILHKLQKRLSRQIFFGHRAVVIIGEKYARHGIDQFLDTLLRAPGSRYNSYFLTANGTTAKQALQTQYMLEAIPAIALKKMQLTGLGLSVKMDEFLDELSSSGRSPVTGALKAYNSKSEDGVLNIDEVAVYQENKLVGFLTPNEKKILIWRRGKLERSKMTAQVEPKVKGFKGTVGIEIMKAKADLRTKINNGMPEVTIVFKAKAKVLENDTRLDLSKGKNLKLVQSKFAGEIEGLIKSTLKHAQKQLKADIFGIGEELHIQHASYWKQNKDQWKDIYPGVPVTVQIDVKIQRTGRIQSPVYPKK